MGVKPDLLNFFGWPLSTYSYSLLVYRAIVAPDQAQWHTDTHSRQDSSGRMISPSQRPLPNNTQHIHETRHPCPRKNSNPSKQAATDTGLKPARLLGWARRWPRGKNKGKCSVRENRENYVIRRFIIFILRPELKSSINQGVSISEIRKGYEVSVEWDSSLPLV
jgi:hypothetical protein